MTQAEAGFEACAETLADRFRHFTVASLVGITPERFEEALNSHLGVVDAEGEGYGAGDLDRQRDLSIKFHWGHDHDFGAFRLEGRMGRRHIDVLARFASLFGVASETYTGRQVLDVGCWCGGTTLMLARLGASVTAIEEVRKYARMARFLVDAFGLADVANVQAMSLYECNRPDFLRRFDRVVMPGVVYHLSDPVLGLRLMFNALLPGGDILVESMGVDRDEPVCVFEGSRRSHSGSREDLDRGGWNWFVPSPLALERMLLEAGFVDVQSVWEPRSGRVYAYATKREEVGICRAGLSMPSVP